MDWIDQNRLKTGLIIFLLALNVITVSIIWMQTSKSRASAASEQQDRRPSESATVMKSALNLTDEQTARFTEMLADYREQTKTDNDRLVTLKSRLADSLFTRSLDTAMVSTTAKEVGETQARIEKSRFWYFREFLAICTPAQQEKLKPILLELFGRRPPSEEPGEGQPQQRPPKQAEPTDNEGEDKTNVQDAVGRKELISPPPKPGHGGPPSVDEKLSKYATSLNLTGAQERQVRAILQDAQQQGEELRKRQNPDPKAIEEERKKVRQEEDQRILKVLDERQHAIFKEMIDKRENQPR